MYILVRTNVIVNLVFLLQCDFLLSCFMADFTRRGLLMNSIGFGDAQHAISSYSSVPATEPKPDNTDNSTNRLMEPLTRYTIADAAGKASPAVVHITVTLGLN